MTRLPLFIAVALVGCQSAAPIAAVSSPATVPASSRPTTSATSRPVPLATRLDEILNRLADTGAIVSARVIDPDTGRELFAQDAARPMTPASNMKLAVTAAALDFFGPDATFETDLIVVGDDLYLVGHGDPATGDAAIAAKAGRAQFALLDAWADELLALGKRSFAGELYYVDGAFDRQQTHPTWGGDLNEWYAAPVAGLNLNDNCVDATATPAATAGAPPAVEVVPATTGSVVVVNEATTDLAPGATSTADWARATNQNLYTVTGSVAGEVKLQSKPVTDPGAFFADALRTRLAARGVTIAGATRRADAPPTGAVTRLKPSVTRFVDVLWRVNKNSQNLLAEGLAKKLGLAFAKRAAPASPAVGSWPAADLAIRAYLARHGIDDAGFTFVDGSGLSRENRVTTRLISDVLLATYRGPHFDPFRESMTIAGVDGTTRKRLTDFPGRTFAKTGYIGGVRSLSGYVRTDAGRYRIFSIIYNKIPGRGIASTKAFEDAQDDAVRALMRD